MAVLFLPVVAASAQQQVPASAAADRRTRCTGANRACVPQARSGQLHRLHAHARSDQRFLQTSWGYDHERIWQVQAILKTPVEGVSKVVVLVGDKTGKQKASALGFFALPDGKHIIAGDEVLPFGEHPYADYRAELQQQADGPYRGAASRISSSSSSPTSSARIARKRRPTWTSSPPISPRRASSSRIILWRGFTLLQ